MRHFAFSALVALAVFAPARLHAQGVRCRDGTVWTANKGRVVCAGHGGVVGKEFRRFRARAAKGTHVRRTITCKDNTTTNTPGPNPCAHHGGINKGTQTR